MHEPIMRRWVEALRSGKYEQTHQKLRNATMDLTNPDGPLVPGPRFCCLGVLCDLFIEDHPGRAEWFIHDTECLFKLNSPNWTAAACLPDEVRKWAGMFDQFGLPVTVEARSSLENVRLADGGKLGYCTLAGANDHSLPFPQMADFIETHWQDL